MKTHERELKFKQRLISIAVASLLVCSAASAQTARAATSASKNSPPTMPDRPRLFHLYASDGTIGDVLASGMPDRHVTFFRGPHGTRLRIERANSKLAGVKTTVQAVGGDAKVELVEHMLFHEQNLKVPRIANVNGIYIAGIDDGGNETRTFLKRVAAEFHRTPTSFQAAVTEFYRYAINFEAMDVHVQDAPDPLLIIMGAQVNLNAYAILPLIADTDGRGPKPFSIVAQLEPSQEAVENFQRDFSH